MLGRTFDTYAIRLRAMPLAVALLLLGAASCARAAGVKVVHVTVALCDNEHQGIVEVPAALGNGQDPDDNLYWGALYGVRTYFTQAPGWARLRPPKGRIATPSALILERAVFFHKATRTYLVADAYDGRHLEKALLSFLVPASRDRVEHVAPAPIHLGRHAHLRAFVGHNGLMDFRLPALAVPQTARPRPAIILACKSAPYFEDVLPQSDLWPLVTTTQLMAPEAYTLEAAVRAWAEGKTPPQVRQAAAAAYAKYQRIALPAARKLFTGAKRTPAAAAADPPAANATETIRRIADIPTPTGYARVAGASALVDYVRRLPLKTRAPVRAWNGEVVKPAAAVTAVIDWPRPHKVQQCADVAIRLWAEYARGAEDAAIVFKSLSGQSISYAKWLRGRYTLSADGQRIDYVGGRAEADTKERFERYLRFVMAYANSRSLARDLPPVDTDKVRPGDAYIQPNPGGLYGHVSLVLDLCESAAGERLYLMGYGFVPAQDFHLPLPDRGNKTGEWFKWPAYKARVAAFGAGRFHRFAPPTNGDRRVMSRADEEKPKSRMVRKRGAPSGGAEGAR